jgi:hypothetical protein
MSCGAIEIKIFSASDGVVTSAMIVFRAILAVSRCCSFPLINLSQSLLVISTTLSSPTFLTSGAKLHKDENTRDNNRNRMQKTTIAAKN